MNIRETIEEHEARWLAPWAAFSQNSPGRKYPEKEHEARTAYQRDRDRIIHAKSFRKLEYKTQVFVNHEGDYYRTRLTHSLEVAQIARTIARMMRLSEDLTEAIALAHDLGHTPFGHAGEFELNELLKDRGGFNHNLQSFRVVETLERRYPDFPGLNLTWELREGILKHSTTYDGVDCSEFIDHPSPSLEAQLVSVADEIAYNNHDLDDGLLSGLISDKELQEVRIWGMVQDIIKKSGQNEHPGIKRAQSVRALINYLVMDLFEASTRRIAESGVKDISEVRNFPEPLIGFSPRVADENKELMLFLSERLYKNYRVVRMTEKAKRIVRDLFKTYDENIHQLPDKYYNLCLKDDKYTVIKDYIAGMTDRYALSEHRKLFDPMTKV